VDGGAKRLYERFPTEEQDMIFFDSSALPDGFEMDGVEIEEVQPADVLKIDWIKMVLSPEGRNKSGTFSMPAEEQDSPDFAMIEVEEVISTAPPRVEEQYAREAVEETIDLDPHTAKEVEIAIRKRTKVYLRKLKNAGYLYFTHKRRISCHISRISWINEYEKNDTEEEKRPQPLPI